MKTLAALSALALSAGLANGQILITGVVDGTGSGGIPKAMEIVAISDIADLSTYFIVKDTNGSSGGTFSVSSDFQLPAVSLNTGEFFYIYGTADSTIAMEGFGFPLVSSNSAVQSSILNANGDDILAVATADDGTGVIDAFGLLGQDDTNFYEDSIAYRPSIAQAAVPTGVADAGNFNIVGYSDELLQSTFGTFAVIPEPSALSLMVGFLGLSFVLIRRRK